MTDDVTIRRATADDLADLVRFTIEEAREAEGRAVTEDVVRVAIARALADERLAKYWVALDGKQRACGYASSTSEWSDWSAAPYVWVQAIYVRPEHRGRGLVERLLAALEADARAAGAAELRLLVHLDNGRAIAAYAKSGFAPLKYAAMAKPLR